MTDVTTLLAGIKTRANDAHRAHVPALYIPTEDLDRVIAALEALAGLHKPFVWEFGFGPVTSCKGCVDQGVSEREAEYPCPTITAAVAALGGGE